MSNVHAQERPGEADGELRSDPTEWSEQFSIGIDMFDEEHKTLLTIMAQLQRAIADRREELELRKIVHDLVEYTFTHCRHEEMYFNDFRYPRAEEHIRQHTEMRRRVLSYCERVDAGETATLAPEILTYLRTWLTIHIQKEDKEFGEYLRTHPSGP